MHYFVRGPVVEFAPGMKLASYKALLEHALKCLSEKNGQSYSKILYWLRCKLRFSLLSVAITCLKESRSSYHPFGIKESAAIDLLCTESRISSFH